MPKKQHLKKYVVTKQWLTNIINLGVTTNLSFEETKRIRMLNLIAMLGLLISTTFSIIQFSNGRNTLGFLNIATMASTITLLFANYKQKYYLGFVLVSTILTIVFTLSSLFYHNGMEFYLLFIAGVLLSIMKKDVLLWFISIADCILFLLLLKYGNNYHWYEPTPESLYFINITIWAIFYFIFFVYFGKLDKKYQANIENRNDQLLKQQLKLTEQTSQLEINNRQLTVLNSTKEKLFAIVAHDVRSPIAGLKTSLDLFNDDILSKEEFMELSKELSLQLNQLHDSLDNLLSWSNRQMKGIETQKQKVYLEPLITDTLSMLQHNLINKNITVNFDSNGNNIINADPDHIKLIVRNLISNAIKFSYAGSNIDLLIQSMDNFIHFSVIDNGVGMKEEALNDLFSDNSLASKRGTSNEKGTGMGLKISREFAEKNGGQIFVKCVPDLGCVFTLTIPAN